MIDDVEVAAVPRRLRHLRPRQRHLPRAGAASGPATPCRRGAGRTSRAWRWPRSAIAKAMRRRQIMVATSSIGPGALNMVTAAGVAHANRLPVLFLVGDTFASRLPDPVLQQVEHFDDPTVTVNDAFKPVSRYWDRIMRPEQVIHSLPHAVAVMLDPADCGPAVLALPARRAGRGVRLPRRFFEHDGPSHRPAAARHRSARTRRCGRCESAQASAHHRRRGSALLAGRATSCAAFAEATASRSSRRSPAGRTLLPAHPFNAGPIGVDRLHQSPTTWPARPTSILAVGTRLQDFTTGSWTVFADDAQIDRAQRGHVRRREAPRSLPVVGDAREGLTRARRALVGDWRGRRRLDD